MKRWLPYVIGFLLIGLAGVVGLEAISIFDRLQWEAQQWELSPSGTRFMRMSGLEIGGFRISQDLIGAYTAILFALTVVLVWLGLRLIIRGRLFRHEAKG